MIPTAIEREPIVRIGGNTTTLYIYIAWMELAKWHELLLPVPLPTNNGECEASHSIAYTLE
jgi:hypothetical protein